MGFPVSVARGEHNRHGNDPLGASHRYHRVMHLHTCIGRHVLAPHSTWRWHPTHLSRVSYFHISGQQTLGNSQSVGSPVSLILTSGQHILDSSKCGQPSISYTHTSGQKTLGDSKFGQLRVSYTHTSEQHTLHDSKSGKSSVSYTHTSGQNT